MRCFGIPTATCSTEPTRTHAIRWFLRMRSFTGADFFVCVSYLYLPPTLLDAANPPTKDFSFDYSKGNAILLDGHIYYSPNCSRPVILPPNETSISFEQERLSASMLRLPVRWSTNHGWLSFIPLTPSYISLPFEPLLDAPNHGIFRCPKPVISPPLVRDGLYSPQVPC